MYPAFIEWFHFPEIPCSNSSSFPPGELLVTANLFFCLYCFAFSKMSCSWAVYCLSYLVIPTLRFLQVFLWLDSISVSGTKSTLIFEAAIFHCWLDKHVDNKLMILFTHAADPILCKQYWFLEPTTGHFLYCFCWESHFFIQCIGLLSLSH